MKIKMRKFSTSISVVIPVIGVMFLLLIIFFGYSNAVPQNVQPKTSKHHMVGSISCKNCGYGVQVHTKPLQKSL